MLARFFLLISAIAFTAIPAEAADGAQVPEGSSLTLFALGLAGVMLGRRIAMRGASESADAADEPSDKS